MQRIRCPIILAFAAVLFPAAAHAQASIAGVVTDSSGAVVPGVTVEASSPALIENVRTAATGGNGAYRSNFVLVDNLPLSATDFATFSVTAPADSRLPGDGGQTISGFKDPNPDTLTRPAENIVRLASDYRDQSQVWSGIDWSVNARMASGMTVSGGLNTGRTITDNCEILAEVPEAGLPGAPYCRQVTNFLTDVKLQSAHTVPVSMSCSASVIVTARDRRSPRTSSRPMRPCSPRSGGRCPAARPTLAAPGTVFGDRLNQLDLRVGKACGPVAFARWSASISTMPSTATRC